MPAAFSPEGLIDTALRDLNCPAVAFTRIATQSGAKIHEADLSRAFAGKKSLEREQAERLLDIVTQMKSLQRAVNLTEGIEVAVNWLSTEKIIRALAYRRLQSAMREVGDSVFDDLAKRATQDVASLSR